jgi:surfactin synthase thioesterase subunit
VRVSDDDATASRPVVAFLPPACCGAGYFRLLRHAFGGSIEFLAVELPGRGRRYREPAIIRAAAAAADVTARIGGHVDAIYGESLGAYLGLVVAAMPGWSRPPKLIAVANSPPSVRGRIDTGQVDSAETAVAAMRALGGEIPEEITDYPELATHAYGMIRDDLRLSQSLIDSARAITIAGDIHVIGGAEDAGLTQLDAWADHTMGRCQVTVLPGGHLLSRRNPAGVASAVLGLLASR